MALYDVWYLGYMLCWHHLQARASLEGARLMRPATNDLAMDSGVNSTHEA